MAIDIEEFKGENSSWYTFPDGTKVQGAEKAQDYADELEKFDAIAEEEAAAVEEDEKRERLAAEAEEHDGDNVVKSSDTKPEPLVAGKTDAEPKPVVDAADGDPELNVTDNKNTPYERESYLVEMTRQNRMFEFAGKKKNYVFRHDAKIIVVDGEDVEDLVEEGGFRIVTPEQAKAYYS